MSRTSLCLAVCLCVCSLLAWADDKPNGNRLTYLDEPCNPYYVHRDFPKLTTPMWVGEEGVEAVVILGIDDMRGHDKWEAYLKPILNRLKQIDGRAPVSIFTCSIDPKQPHLQQWLEEGSSLEIHTIENYPYPYVLDRLCREFPWVAPSDWSAQHLHQPNNPQTVEDWKAALDCTVIKQGVFCLVFHPHNWIKPEQVNELIGYAVTKYGKKAKFLTFKDAVERLYKNVAFSGLREPPKGTDTNVRFLNWDHDGHLDALTLGARSYRIRAWSAAKYSWLNANVLLWPFEKTTTWLNKFDAHEVLPPTAPKPIEGRDHGVRLIDLCADGYDDVEFSNHERYGIWLRGSLEKGWSRELLSGQRGSKPANEELPPIVREDGSNNGFWVHARNLVWMNEDTAKSNDLVECQSFEELLARGSGKNAQPTEDGPKSPEESLKLMQVKPGYRVELVAAEPLVLDPVAFDWGPDGKLWVAEMADYPLGVPEEESGTDNTDVTEKINKNDSNPKPPVRSASSVSQNFDFKKGGGRVRILEDTDGDGKYDKSTVFLDKLNFPNGVMPWRDGVLISAAPDVLFARDTNGDNKADEVKILLTGFGEGNQQHRVNGFSWGLDNMVHCANGDSGGSIKVVATVGSAPADQPRSTNSERSAGADPTHVGKTIDIRGRDFRWNPDTGEIDPTSGQTQFGRNRDDFGNWFGNNNANPMYHFVLDDYYTRRNPHVAPPDPKKHVSITPGPSPVFPISRTLARFNDFAMANRFTSANSAMVYRDTILFESRDESPEFRATPKQAPSPSSLSTHQHVFISEPVHNLVHHEIMTADGVTFTSRRPDDEQQSEFLASKDNWFRPTQIKTGPDGALYIADMYRQVIEHPQYIPPAMQEKLDLRAGHDKGRIYRVVRVSEPRPAEDAKANVWPLSRAKQEPLSRFDELYEALRSPNGTVRDLAHRLIYWKRVDAEKNVFGLSLREKDPIARLHVLSILDGLRRVDASELSLALGDSHSAVRRRGLQATENFDGNLPDPLINQFSALSRDPDPFVRMQFAYTLGHPKFASLGNELGKLLYRERDDKYLVAAAMSSIHAKNVASVVANVFESAGKEPLPPQLASMLLNLAATLGEDQALLSLIEYVLSGAATTEAQPVMLATVLETLDRRGTSLSKLRGIGKQRLAQAEQQLTERIEAARKQISDFQFQISNDPAQIENHKSQIENALPLLGRVPDQRGNDAQLVGGLLVPQSPVPAQSAAVATLARINHAESATAMLSGWRTFTPTLRAQVLDALLSRAAWTDKLLDSLEAKSIAPSDIDAVRRQRLIAHSNEVIRTRAVNLLKVSENADRQKIVAEFAAKLKEGNIAVDPTRGADVFKKRCATCHKLKEIGTSVGSDLMSLTDKSTAALLTAILDPNKAVESKFLAYTAVNKQGQTFSGLIAAETGNSITLMAADGKQQMLLRADLDEFISSAKSFMPEGLEKDISPSQLADVIAFVQSSGPTPKKFDGNHPEPVTAEASGTLRLLATNAEIYGKTLVFEPFFKNLGYWQSVDDRAVWTINVTKPGKHSIRLNYACDNSTAGNEVVFAVGNQSVKAKVVGTGAWENYQTAILGELKLSAGQHRLTVRATESLKDHLMDLKELRLVPE
ncbi:MAG: c-type cytochrome [Planctomycetes bacterium]|nr:c-type cytochrome [Planctomycetota bacterium]